MCFAVYLYVCLINYKFTTFLVKLMEIQEFPVFHDKNQGAKATGRPKKSGKVFNLFQGHFSSGRGPRFRPVLILYKLVHLIIMLATSCVDSLASSTCFYCAADKTELHLILYSKVFSIRNNVGSSDFCQVPKILMND